MPTKTFLNLPENKKDIILNSAIQEFKRVPLKDASINKIIATSNISRGSFYTYFKDINDIYIYSLKFYEQKIMKIIETALIKNDGDIIKTSKDIFDYISLYCTKEKNKDLFKNVFINMNYNSEIRVNLEKNMIENKYATIEFISKIDKTSLNIKEPEEIIYIVELISGLIMHNLIDIFIKDITIEEARHKLVKQIELIERGIVRDIK